MSRVGFIGLGNQGAPIARRIAACFPAMVWARRPEACVAVPQAMVAPSLAELGAACDVIALCVSGDDDVRELALGLSATMAEGSVLIVHSTVSPGMLVELAAILARRGISLVDAPVSGGPERAERGDLVVLGGAARPVFDRVRPIFESFASLIEYLGDVGAGQRMKLVNNGLFFANATTAASAMRLACELGIDPAAAGRILAAGTGNSTAFNVLDIGTGGLSRFKPRAIVEKDIHHLGVIAEGKSVDATLLVELARRFRFYTVPPKVQSAPMLGEGVNRT